MKRLILRLRPSKEARDRAGDGYTRPSFEDLKKIATANAEQAERCVAQLRRALPGPVEVAFSGANTGLLVVSDWPEEVAVDDLKRMIMRACPEVDVVGSDFDLYLVK